MNKLFSLIFLLAFSLFAANTYLNNANDAVNQSDKLRNGERQFVYVPETAVQMVIGDTLWLIKASTSVRAGYDYDGIDTKVGADSIITWIKLEGHETDTVNMAFLVQHSDKILGGNWLTRAIDTLVVDTTKTAALYRLPQIYIPGSYWRAMLVILDATDTVNVISIRRFPKY